MDTFLSQYNKSSPIGNRQALNFLFATCLQNCCKLLALCLVIFALPIVAESSPQTKVNPSFSAEYFIEFQPGNYHQCKTGSIDNLIQKIEKTTAEHQIKLVGYSQSQTSFASKSLALQRADVVKKALVNHGIAAQQIKIYSEYENFKSEGELLHGVLAIVTPISSDAVVLKTNTGPKKNLSNNNKTIGFIAFLPAVYDREISGEINKILPKLNQLPATAKIKIIGISQSKTSLATKKLAQQRAQVVVDSLVASGIAKERLLLDAEITNFIENNYLTHGVRIFAEIGSSTAIQTVNLNPKTPTKNKPTEKQQALNNIIKQLDPSLDTSSKSATDLCTELHIETGSLKKNIQREISECGYLMGEWNFGTEDEYIDWLIPVAYRVDAEKGILEILTILEKNYQIRAHVHQMDMSIDFLPSIKRDKG